METRENNIDLREMLGVLKKKFWLISLITLIITIATGVYTYYYITPQYQATTELLVNKEDPAKQGVINQQEMFDTYSGIMTSPRILKIAADKLNMKGKEKALAGKINITSVKNSQIMSITVTDTNQKQAATIANTVADTFKTEIVKIMNINNVQILTEAVADPGAAPVKPNKTQNIMIAFVVGLLVSIGLAFLLDFLDRTIKTDQDVERKLGLPVLGSITVMKEKDIKVDPLSNHLFQQVAATKEERR